MPSLRMRRLPSSSARLHAGELASSKQTEIIPVYADLSSKCAFIHFHAVHGGTTLPYVSEEFEMAAAFCLKRETSLFYSKLVVERRVGNLQLTSFSKILNDLLLETEKLLETRKIMSDLLSLPDELLVMILDYCSTWDLIQVSQVCQKLNDITCDKKIIRILNLHCQSKINQRQLKSFVSLRSRAENVTTIDLTSCYWLKSSFIHDVIARLQHVENVLVADTVLRPNHLKQLLQTLPRIKRLSWTWSQGMNYEGIEEALQKLEFLFLCFKDRKYVYLDSIKWVNKCVQLRELWINSIYAYNYMTRGNPMELENLENIVLYPSCSWPEIKTKARLKQVWRAYPPVSNLGNEQLLNIESILTYRWREITYVVGLGAHKIQRLCCQESFGPDIGEVLSLLNVLKVLHIVMSVCTQAQDSLYNSLVTNQLCELNLDAKNKSQECSIRFCEIASCCQGLKYIGLPIQAIVCPARPSDSADLAEPSTSSRPSRGMDFSKTALMWMDSHKPCCSRWVLGSSDRARVSRISEIVPKDSPFRKMVQSTPLVEVCEIGVSGVNNSDISMPKHLEWDSNSLSAISLWKNLTFLTLANLPVKQTKFLSEIVKGCAKLRSLKLVDLGSEAQCVYSNELYVALPCARVLEDFHWTQSYVGSTSRLWTALQKIPTLRRVALCLQGESSVNEEDVYKTMEECPSLFFLHVATCSTQVKNKMIKNYLVARWTEKRPHLCVWFGAPGDFLDSAMSSPTVHSGEMLQEFSRIKGFPVSGSHFLSFGKRDWVPHM